MKISFRLLKNIVIILAIIFFCSNIIFNSINTVNAGNSEEFIIVMVNEGDTLWSIAKKYNFNNEDIRKVIYNIEQVNNIEKSIIYPGQQLKVPTY